MLSKGSSSLLALSSQLLGLLQLWLLIRGGKAGLESDAYFLLFAWGGLPAQIILQGVIYPLWIRGSDFSRRAFALVIAGVCSTSVSFVLLAGYFLASIGKGYPALSLHLTLFAVLSVFGALNSASALRIAASSGNARWLSAVTLPGSAVACIFLSFSPDSGTARVTYLSLGLLIGAALFLLLIMWKVPSEPWAARGKVSKSDGISGAWFMARSVSGYGSGLVLQTLTAVLPASSLTVLGIITKIIGGFSTVVTNTVLPMLINRSTTQFESVLRYLWYLAAVVGLGALVCAPVLLYLMPQYYQIGMLAFLWILASSSSAALQRILSKFFAAKYSLISIVVAVAVPLVVIWLSGYVELCLESVVLAYCALDGVIALILLIKFRAYFLFCLLMVESGLFVSVL